MDDAVGNAAPLSGVCQRHAFPLICDEPIGAFVSGLPRPSRPSTVLGRVVAIVIDAVDCQTRRAWAHVREEVFKPVPSLADLDAATAVDPKVAVVGVTAPSQHRAPKIVFGQMIIAAGCSVSCLCFSRGLYAKAAATECSAFSQRPADNIPFCAALTLTMPKMVAFPRVRSLDNRPTTKSLSRKIRDPLAPTTSCSALPQSIAPRDAFVATDAHAAPERPSFLGSAHFFEHSQMPEHLAGNIYGSRRARHVRL